MRLIDADVLKERFWNGAICEGCPDKKPRCYDCDAPDYLTSDLERLIDRTPTVDAEPVKHGHWIVYDEVVAGMYHEVSECSECGMTTDRISREHMPFCYSCGARMDGAQNV